jgi:hypothetical protein
MTITQAQLNRAEKMLRGIAAESVTVELYDSALWVFGSELATLRLLVKYRECTSANAGYSKNLNSFYFKLELDHPIV